MSTVLVLGSGPIRIGQGIEFDYSCVHCVWSLEAMGHRAVIVNNNPETVSTDFDTGDGLYFEPVTLEDVLDVVAHERPVGVVVQFGGQTAINLAEGLHASGVKILGTPPEAIAAAEDRDQFEHLLTRLGIPKPPGRAVRSLEEAVVVAKEIGYPVLVRPSFVLGGRAMEIVFDESHLRGFYWEAEEANPGQPVLVDKYILGTEAEVDVISDGVATLVPGIMEHVERAGVHSGDSMAVYPPVALSTDVQAQMVRSACRLARELGVKGLMNIQFVIADDAEGKPTAYVLEVNPRGSRTVPYVSKVTGIPMVDLAARCMMGSTLEQMGYGSGLWWPDPEGPMARGDSPRPHVSGRVIAESEFERRKPVLMGGAPDAAPPVAGSAESNLVLPEPRFYAVKAPVFSFQKLSRVEPSLGPEMKSTGEVLGVDFTYEAALYKALVASGIVFKGRGRVLLSVQDSDKDAAIEIGRKMAASGFKLNATGGTARRLREAGIECETLLKISEGSPNLLDTILRGEVSLMVNTPSPDKVAELEAARIRRACIETGVACVTNIDTAAALARTLGVFAEPNQASCLRLEEYLQGNDKR